MYSTCAGAAFVISGSWTELASGVITPLAGRKGGSDPNFGSLLETTGRSILSS